MTMQVENFLPHRSLMKLIDSIIEINEKTAICEVIIREENIFYNSAIQGVYAWIGVEFMAQAVAIFACHHNKQAIPELGLLLSVRKFISYQAHYQDKDRLIIKAHQSYIEDNVGVFETEIFIQDKLIASAKLNTYQPPREQLHNILKGNRF